MPKKIVEIIELETNFYTYEGVVKALNKISLDIYHGETFGLVGESGCGKSVAVRSMMRIIQAPGKIDGGKVLLHFDQNGGGESIVDLLQQSENYMQALRGDQISMIFQEPNAALNPIMSVGDQVSESFLFHQKTEICQRVIQNLKSPHSKIPFPFKQLLLSLYGYYGNHSQSILFKLIGKVPILKRWDRFLKKEAMDRSIEIIEKLGISNGAELVTRYPHNLSGGMKQRIVIAIALACNPMLLVADEATSNLDVTIQAQILELIKDLRKKEISSILLITHDLGVVAETCDRVGVMYAGNVCEIAEVKELFKNPKHPYTKALLSSVPRVTQKGELLTIEGNVPNLVTPPVGCRFHPDRKSVV